MILKIAMNVHDFSILLNFYLYIELMANWFGSTVKSMLLHFLFK